MITYDSAFYHSELRVLKSLWDGCCFCSKGMSSQGGSFCKRWVGKPCLRTAACYGCVFMTMIFHPIGSKFISFIFFSQKKQREALETHVGINRKPGEKKKIKEETRIHTTKNRNFKDMTYGKEKLKF